MMSLLKLDTAVLFSDLLIVELDPPNIVAAVAFSTENLEGLSPGLVLKTVELNLLFLPFIDLLIFDRFLFLNTALF